LARFSRAQDALFELLENGALRIAFYIEEHVSALTELHHKYRDRPMSLADACIVRMTEIHERHAVLTKFGGDTAMLAIARDRPIPRLWPSSYPPFSIKSCKHIYGKLAQTVSLIRTSRLITEKATWTAPLLLEGLKRAGPQPDTEKLVDSLETIRNYDMGLGTLISFSEHQGSHKYGAHSSTTMGTTNPSICSKPGPPRRPRNPVNVACQCHS